MITVTINDKKIELEKQVTILAAARSAGIEIPTLCNHELLEPFGGCRLCVVEVEKMPRLQSSCSLYVTDGMVVRTDTEKVIEARKSVLEFLLINHALDCPYCDKAGECELQDAVMKHGEAHGRFTEQKRNPQTNYEDPVIVRNMKLCILCGRCVRMCDEIQCASAIAVTGRGHKSLIEPFSGGVFDCEYCGNCLPACPVGALMSKLHKHTYRPWYIDKNVGTVCSHCGVGCYMIAQMRGDSLIRVWPEYGRGTNKGILCRKGMFDYEYIGRQDRLTKPLIRRGGKLVEASHEEAIAHISEKLKYFKSEEGPCAIAGIISPKCTNEDAYAFQKFMRTVIRTNNVDSIAGLFFAQALTFFERIFGKGATSNSILDIAKADGALVIGGDPFEENPVLGIQIRRAAKKGKAAVIVVGGAEGLKRFILSELKPASGTQNILLSALFSELIKRRPICGDNLLFEETISAMDGALPEDAAKSCGVSVEDINKAVDELLLMTNPVVVVGRDAIDCDNPQAGLLLTAALSYIINAKIYLLSPYPNERGIVDTGCLPALLPGGKSINVESFKKQFADVSGGNVPASAGLSMTDILIGCASGSIKALYVFGEDALAGFPDKKLVKDALSKVEFVVVHDILPSELLESAHVVMPSPSWLEKKGTYTNIEGIVQRLEKGVDNAGMPDWKVLSEIAKIMGHDLGFKNTESVFTELCRLVSGYAQKIST
jgi:NADH-quinone oxidoreductase chain G